MSYSKEYNYNNIPSYNNQNYDNKYAYHQRKSSMIGMNHPHFMMNKPNAFNGYKQNYGNVHPPVPMHAYMNADQRRNSCRALPRHVVKNVETYTNPDNRRNRNLSYQPRIRKSSEYSNYESSESSESSSSEDSANVENAIRISNHQGKNNLHVSYKQDRKRGNGKNKNKVVNENIIQLNYNEGETEYDDDNYRNENINNIDICDASGNDGNTCITIKVNDNINAEGECIDDEKENEESMYNNTKKNTKPRKLFMGRYSMSDVKKNFMRPSHFCPAHPNLSIPNPNIACYGLTPKQREKLKKPELIVRY